MVKIAIPQMGTDLFRKYMKSKYSKSLEQAGGEVLWIELENKETAIKQALSCEGLLLPGGADVNPALYGEELDEKCGKPNEIRDEYENIILDEFIKTGKPILGICRGAQVINVHFGGTLYQDIKDKQEVNHSSFFTRAKSAHDVMVKRNSILYSITECEKMPVNSLHHQAIKTLAPTLKVAAESEDGFIEAVEIENYGFGLALQWHPEHMSGKSEIQRKIFRAFIVECEKVKNQE